MSIYIRPFKKEDFEAFDPIEPMLESGIKNPEFVQAIEDSKLAVTGVRNGKVFGCAGVHPVKDDDFNGEMWLRLSPDCLNHKLDTLRWIRDGLVIVEETFPFSQLNATIKCCFEQSMKMMEYLGFTKTQEVEHEGMKWAIYSKRIAI